MVTEEGCKKLERDEVEETAAKDEVSLTMAIVTGGHDLRLLGAAITYING